MKTAIPAAQLMMITAFAVMVSVAFSFLWLLRLGLTKNAKNSWLRQIQCENVQKLHTLRKIAWNETKCQNKRINLFSCKEFPLLQIFMHLIVHIRKCIQTFTLCFIVGATNRPTLFPHRSHAFFVCFFLTVVFSWFSFSSSRMRTFE